MSNKMLEIKKLKDFMKERGIQEGEQSVCCITFDLRNQAGILGYL